jgi:transposase
VKRLETVPGVGPIVALTAIAVFAEVGRLTRAKHAASCAGLVPSTFQSGERDAHGHITKRGSAELRAMLCEADRASFASLLRQGLHPAWLHSRSLRSPAKAALDLLAEYSVMEPGGTLCGAHHASTANY